MPEDPRPILLPLDGSSNAELAVPHAITLARAWATPLRIVHVVEREGAGGGELAAAERRFHTYAEGLLETHGAGSIERTVEAVGGNPAAELLARSADTRAVVLATHGRGGLHAALIGSVADKVIRGAEVPVLAVPLGAHAPLGPSPIVVGVDGSKIAEAGLEAARDLATRLSSQIVLVRTYSLAMPAVDFGTYPVDLSEALREGAETYLAEIARPGEDRICRLASPAVAIVEVAGQVDAGLIVLTSHGKGFFQRLTLGSTTDRVLHATNRPLLVVRSPQHA